MPCSTLYFFHSTPPPLKPAATCYHPENTHRKTMKHLKLEPATDNLMIKHSTPLQPPFPKFLIRKSVSTESVTNQEIAKFWRRKRILEEDHLLSAIKAAAIVRGRNLTKDDYKSFEDSLKNEEDENTVESHVGIKDWWTKSKYAYLNQPAMESKDRRSSSYIPNYVSYKPTSLYPTSLGVY